MKHLNTTIALLLIFTLQACGSEDAPEPSARDSVFTKSERFKFIGKDFLVVEGEAEVRANSLQGDATIIAVQPIGSIMTDTHFSVEVELLDSGSIEFLAFTNRNLKDGVGIELSEDGLRVRGPAGDHQIQSDTRSFSVDIHNTEDPVHLVLWDELGAGLSTPAVLDTAEDAVDLGAAKGNFLGFKIRDARLLSFQQKKPVIVH